MIVTIGVPQADEVKLARPDDIMRFVSDHLNPATADGNTRSLHAVLDYTLDGLIGFTLVAGLADGSREELTFQDGSLKVKPNEPIEEHHVFKIVEQIALPTDRITLTLKVEGDQADPS